MSIEDDYRIVNAQGDVVFDSAMERQREDQRRAEREGEPFTATVDCPWCGHVAVHWLDSPRREPDPHDRSPIVVAQRSIANMMDTTRLVFGGPPHRHWDAPGTVVARICVSCKYRWGQS